MKLPKCYSEQEREYIKKRLKEEAGKCLVQYGVRRTTVDEIVKRVNIPKGTFYLFYQSKELLLFDVILEQHDLIEKELYKAISNIDTTSSLEEQLTNIIVQFYIMAAETPMLKILNSEEIELLARKLPPEVLQEHLGHDDSMIDKVFSSLPIKKEVDAAAFSGAFRAIYFATLHKNEIGQDEFEKAVYLLVRGLISQLLN